MKFAHIRKANISYAAGVFHISQKYFTCPQGQILLKKALAYASAFSGRGAKTRTLDTQFWRLVFYRLNYTPKYFACIVYHTFFEIAIVFLKSLNIILTVVKVHKKECENSCISTKIIKALAKTILWCYNEYTLYKTVV